MYVYHYGVEPYKTIKTLELLNRLSKDRMDEMDAWGKNIYRQPYYKQVSFFLEPLPVEVMGKLFENANHDLYNDGTVLYEHVVKISDLRNILAWRMVETPNNVEYYKTGAGKGYDNASDEEQIKILRGSQAFLVKQGEASDNYSDLLTTIPKFNKGILKAFQASRIKNPDSNLYAEEVPHLMVYVNKPIKITKVNKRTIGEPTLEYLKW